MLDTYSLGSEDHAGIEALLLGRRIVAAEMGVFFDPGEGMAYSTYSGSRSHGWMTLDDGTQIYVIPNDGGCSCGAGDYDLAKLASADNVITRVRVSEQVSQLGQCAKSYKIFVFADATEINILQVDGEDGNGYYGTGYVLHVVVGGVA